MFLIKDEDSMVSSERIKLIIELFFLDFDTLCVHMGFGCRPKKFGISIKNMFRV